MKMKTERGRRKVGRRLGLHDATEKDTIRRVSLHRPVERNTLPRPPEAPEEERASPPERQREEVLRAPADEQG